MAAIWSELLDYLTPEELAEIEDMATDGGALWSPLPGPQSMALESEADIVGYGGAAGGGKTDLLAGLSLIHHKRCLIVRREKAQTEGIVQRITELLGHSNGLNSQKGIWKLPNSLLELAGLDNPGDEKRWQGRPHDLKAFDEVTEMREAQVRFIMGWTRTNDPSVKARVLMTFNPPTTNEGRWVLAFFAPWLDDKHPNPAMPGELRWYTTVGGADFEVADGRPCVFIDGKPCYDFKPKDYRPEDIVQPKSRTFIPARLVDNPYYMATGYMSQLQSLPEPLRSQMLNGDFKAGIKEDPWQVIPTAWVDAAMARWVKPHRLPDMDSLGIDVARGGEDKTIIARRHGNWFDEPLVYEGQETPDGPKVAGLTIAASRNRAVQHIDVIGVGSSPYDFLMQAHQPVIGVDARVTSTATDQSGLLRFFNFRSEMWWKMREDLDPNNNKGLCLPPDPKLRADLCTPKWNAEGKTIKVESRENIIKRINRSPDWGSAYVMARLDTPKIEQVRTDRGQFDYDPYRGMASGTRATQSKGYDPYGNIR